MLTKLRKLVKISPSEWLLLSQLILFSLAVAVALKSAGLSRLIGSMARCAVRPWFSFFPVPHGRHEIARLSAIVELATRVTHGQRRCLARSLLLFWLLKARGEPGELLIGVCKEASALNSHAWIESQGMVMADSPDIIGRFATLLRF